MDPRTFGIEDEYFICNLRSDGAEYQATNEITLSKKKRKFIYASFVYLQFLMNIVYKVFGWPEDLYNAPFPFQNRDYVF